MFDEGELDIPETVTDRAHKTKTKSKAIIVKFPTFRQRSLAY